MMKRVLIPLAPGFEEIEAITVIDILRRANVEVVVAGTVAGPIEACRATRHLPDCPLDDLDHRDDRPFDMIVLPGGQPGTTNLHHDPRIRQWIDSILARDGLVAAICAAPSLLAAYGVLDRYTATSHPTVAKEVAAHAAGYSEERVVVDGPVITSRAAGTAMEFAFVLVEHLCGRDKADEVNQGVLAGI